MTDSSSKLLPIYNYPGGTIVDPPTSNTTFKWVDSLGGGILSGPIVVGTLRPDGKTSSCGVMTTNDDGSVIVEYHGG
jgi:hypothetical protein